MFHQSIFLLPIFTKNLSLWRRHQLWCGCKPFRALKCETKGAAVREGGVGGVVAFCWSREAAKWWRYHYSLSVGEYFRHLGPRPPLSKPLCPVIHKRNTLIQINIDEMKAKDHKTRISNWKEAAKVTDRILCLDFETFPSQLPGTKGKISRCQWLCSIAQGRKGEAIMLANIFSPNTLLCLDFESFQMQGSSRSLCVWMLK